MAVSDINVNGCLWCGVLWRDHGQRYDNLHPPGVHLYTEPTNEIRKARLLLNIFNRRYPQLSAMRRDK